MSDISIAEARRIALAAQGFYDAPPARVTPRSLVRVLNRIKILQIDSVNVLVRSHYMPMFSRLGPYPVTLLHEMAYGPRAKRELFEYWGHEASLMPLSMQPLFRWRMERAQRRFALGSQTTELLRAKPRYVESIVRRIERDGPMTASSFEGARGTGPWWGWSDVKIALEYLFRCGRLMTAARTKGFERVYDIPQRVLPENILSAPTPGEAEAHRELVRSSVAALGIATERDIKDYFRLDVRDARTALRDTLEAGTIVAVDVQGWKTRGYLSAGTSIPRRAPNRTALLSPFDSLIWERDRVHRLFEFRYRIEIYTPVHKRIHGYYVLPFLDEDCLIARVDLKADRGTGVLRVVRVTLEPTVGKLQAERAMMRQLQSLCSWLGLNAVEFGKQV